MGIDDGVGEDVHQHLATGAQGLDRCQAVIDGVGPAAVGVHYQVAIQPAQRGAQGASGAGTRFATGADGRHPQHVALKVAIVAQHIAAGVQARCGVVQAAGLDGRGVIVNAIGCIVAANDNDRQLGKVGQAAKVGDFIGEVLDQGLQHVQGQYRRITGVDGVGVTAVGIEHQRAVQALKDIADRTGNPCADFGAGTDSCDCELIALVDIAVVGQHVAAGVEHQTVAVVGYADIDVVLGHRCVPGALDDQVELRGILGASSVAHTVGEGFLERITGLEGLDHGQGIVDLVLIVAIGEHRQGAVSTTDNLAAVDRSEGAASRFATSADTVERLAVAGVDVAIIAQQVTGRIYAGSAVIGATGFHCHGVVVDGQRVVVAALDGDGQGRGTGGPGQVANGVGERFAQGVVGRAQGLHQRVIVIDQVGVAAIGIEDQAAVLPGKAATHSAAARALSHTDDAQGFAEAVDIDVVVQHIAARIAAGGAVVQASGLNREGIIVVGHRRIIAAADGDGQ
ncbi:hypothetical protein D3C78_743720 [compost metagenome]